MSDIPVRPPAPAPALPAGWTEHKAPSGSYTQLSLASHASTNVLQAIHTTTTQRQESQHTRDLLLKFHNITIQRRLLHLLPIPRLQPTTLATIVNKRKSLRSRSLRSMTLSLQARRNSFQSMAGRINNHEVDTGEECAEGTTISTTEEKNGTINQNIAKTYQTARHGCW